jgi:hypothetical protein
MSTMARNRMFVTHVARVIPVSQVSRLTGRLIFHVAVPMRRNKKNVSRESKQRMQACFAHMDIHILAWILLF